MTEIAKGRKEGRTGVQTCALSDLFGNTLFAESASGYLDLFVAFVGNGINVT